MTNTLVGDVYQKIIEEVVNASRGDFEESGVGSQTLSELQKEWQTKLSARGVAQMPWDPKPQPPPQPAPSQSSSLPSAPNGIPANPYGSYDQAAAHGQRIKTEPGTEQQYHGLPNGGYQQNGPPPQGGAVRAAQLLQQQYGNSASASVNAMQRSGGLALPGQQQKPTGIQLPANPVQQSYQQQQQAAMARQQQQIQQQQQQQQQQGQPRVKMESNNSPQLQQGSFQQQRPPNYTQTDGADDEDEADDLRQWRAMLAERRAISAEQTRKADSLMRDQVMALSANLQSGLMVPLNEQPSSRVKKQKNRATLDAIGASSASAAPSIPQLDGDVDDDDEEKPDIKDEDDADAINSDLDDSDDEGAGAMGDDDDELGDSILCTYDKVQRVKNKWKCTLKDGVMSVNGKEWVFHKGQGEFEW